MSELKTSMTFGALQPELDACPTSSPAIVGGKLSVHPTAITELLAYWQFPQAARNDNQSNVYVLLERIDCLRFERVEEFFDGTARSWRFDHAELIERLRVFGAAADFEIRRDGDALYWRLISDVAITPRDPQPGSADGPAPNDTLGRADYWDPPASENAFVSRPISLNLWGSRDDRDAQPPQIWYDERVAASQVTYPIDGSFKRVYITGTEYIAEGITQFVQWRGLEGE